MPHGSRLCPYCRTLQSVGEERCQRCARRLPGPILTEVLDLSRTALGEQLRMTKLLAGICAVVFALGLLSQGRHLSLFGGLPMSEYLRFGAVAAGLAEREPWRYLAAVFVHFGALHFLVNLSSLVSLGKLYEERIGAARYGILFVASGGLGFVASVAWYRFTGANALTAGASGGLFGLSGAVVADAFARSDPDWKPRLINAAFGGVAMALLFPVNNAAHLAGFLVGAPLGYLFAKESRPWRRTGLVSGLAVLLIAASIGSIVLSARSPIWQEVRRDEQAESEP